MTADMIKVVSYLIGTPESLQKAEEEFNNGEEFTIEELRKLDEKIFLCAGCGWWHEMPEAECEGGDQYCEDCAEDMLGAGDP